MAIPEISEEVKRVLDSIIKYHVTSNKPIDPRFLSGYLIAAGLKTNVSIQCYLVKIVIGLFNICLFFFIIEGDYSQLRFCELSKRFSFQRKSL